MNYQLYTLKNGLKIILVPIQEMASATTMLMVGAGSRYETKKNNGISHFLEHMAFKGTKKRPSAREIASLIDGIGAESNAFTGKELTGYYIKSSAQHVPLALELLSDMLINSLFDEKEIEKEKGVILEEINLYEDTPSRRIGDVFESLLYGNTPMGWDIAGEKSIIKAVTRDDFISYMKSLYSAKNMVLVVAGKINEDIVKAKITEFFEAIPSFDTISYQKSPDSQKGSQVFLKKKKTEQAHFALGVRTVSVMDKEDKYPISVLSSILGGGMSSRLFHEVREQRGLAYYVRSYAEMYMDRGYLATFAGVDPKRIQEAIKVVKEEYEKIITPGNVSSDELLKAKEYMKGHFILEIEDTKSLAAYYSDILLREGKIESAEEEIKRIEAVRMEDIERVTKKYLKSNELNLGIIGNFDDQGEFEKLIK